MYTKLVQKPAIREARELLANGEALLVFEHSNSCPVSFTAKRRYDQFLAANPDVPTRLVVVQQERALSNALETVRRLSMPRHRRSLCARDACCGRRLSAALRSRASIKRS